MQLLPAGARDRRALLVALQALLMMLIATLVLPSTYKWHSTDMGGYLRAALALAGGQLPYRDFALEYPPLALVPFALPLLALAGQPPTLGAYAWRLLIQHTLLSSLVAVLIGRLAARWQPERPLRPLILYALLVGLLAPLLPWRYDLFPALLTLLALDSLQRGAAGRAGLWLGCGVAAKLYPVVLLPIFAAYYVAGRDWRALLRLALGSAAAVGAVALPLLLLAPGDVASFLSYHQQRGLQLESLPAGVILLAQLLGGPAVGLVYNYGALHLVSPLADRALAWLPLAFVALFGAVLLRYALRFRGERQAAGQVAGSTLVAACVAALLAFIVANKVLSPQYLIWLLPFVALLPPGQAPLLLLAYALTTALFPFNYEGLLAMRPLPVLLLNLRNALLLGLLLALLAPARGALDRRPASRPYSG